MTTAANTHMIRVDVRSMEPGQTRAIQAGGHDLLLCNVDGEFFVVENRCSHATSPLAGGRLEGCILECPMHGGKLDVRDGSPQHAPVRKPVPTYPVRLVNDLVEITLDS